MGSQPGTLDRSCHPGLHPSGKRIVKRASGTSKTAAQRKLKELIRDYEDGLVLFFYGYTVAQAVSDWLAHGLSLDPPR